MARYLLAGGAAVVAAVALAAPVPRPAPNRNPTSVQPPDRREPVSAAELEGEWRGRGPGGAEVVATFTPDGVRVAVRPGPGAALPAATFAWEYEVMASRWVCLSPISTPGVGAGLGSAALRAGGTLYFSIVTQPGVPDGLRADLTRVDPKAAPK